VLLKGGFTAEGAEGFAEEAQKNFCASSAKPSAPSAVKKN
jgi:hypothetical protein